jgi:hypothetical protein
MTCYSDSHTTLFILITSNECWLPVFPYNLYKVLNVQLAHEWVPLHVGLLDEDVTRSRRGGNVQTALNVVRSDLRREQLELITLTWL